MTSEYFMDEHMSNYSYVIFIILLFIVNVKGKALKNS